MSGSAWNDISEEAKDFVRLLLNKCGNLIGIRLEDCFDQRPRINAMILTPPGAHDHIASYPIARISGGPLMAGMIGKASWG